MAIAAGADALGLVGAMPSGPGIIDTALIAEVARIAPPTVATFLLSSATDAQQLIAEAATTAVSTLQIVDAVPAGTYRHIRRALPALKLVQVIHVEDERAVDEARALSGEVDAILLDSGRPSAPVRELGGTGRAHDWEISRRVVAATALPVFLAGGLRPENVARAVATVGPFGLDLCSGVRSGGRLDQTKLAAFMQAVEALGA